MKRLLISGMPKSGTSYICTALSPISPLIKHEEIYRANGDVENWVGLNPWIEVAWPAMIRLSELPPDVVVIHQVRDPIRNVRSWLAQVDGFHWTDHPALGKLRPLFKGLSERDAALLFWIEWNLLARECKNPIYRWRIEDVTHAKCLDILKRLGFEGDYTEAQFQRAKKGENSHWPARKSKYPIYDWDDFENQSIVGDAKALAKDYGYTIDGRRE